MIWLTHRNGGLYLVRASSIDIIDPTKDGSFISFSNGRQHEVEETAHAILEAMDGAAAHAETRG